MVIKIISPLITLVIGGLLALGGKLFFERLKSKFPQIRKIRILCLDDGITKQDFFRIFKHLKQSSLLKNIIVIEDYQGDANPSIINALIKYEKGFARKIPVQKIEDYESKKNEFDKICLSSIKLKKRLEKDNEDTTLATFALTTYPLFDEEEKEVWINAGTYEEIKKKKKNVWEKVKQLIYREVSKISIFPIQKEEIKSDFENVLANSEHQIAHLLGISDYKFAC